MTNWEICVAFHGHECGSHSLVYGSTRHHVLEARGVLCDGSIEVFKEYTIKELEERFGPRFWETDRLCHSEQGQAGMESISGQFQQTSLIQNIYSQLINWALDEKTVQLIEENYPDYSALVAGIREQGADMLAKIMPKEIPHVREVGSIVTFWRLMESVVSVVLESGLLTKSRNGRNPTAFYFKI